MNLVEAYECGKMVRHPSALRTAIQAGRSLRWLDNNGHPDTYVTVDNVILHGWELVPEPPKRYTFEEALVMMRQGKWMRPVNIGGSHYSRTTSGQWLNKDSNGLLHQNCVLFAMSNTDQMWEERP